MPTRAVLRSGRLSCFRRLRRPGLRQIFIVGRITAWGVACHVPSPEALVLRGCALLSEVRVGESPSEQSHS